MFSMIEHFPADFPIPIIIVQHMPENFTKAFADRLNRSGKIRVSEAYDGQELQPGGAYVAPGGMQTLVTRVNGKYVIRIRKSPAELYYRPCIDITLGSLSKIYNDRVRERIRIPVQGFNHPLLSEKTVVGISCLCYTISILKERITG